jgi:hypothetical protein
MKALEKRLRLLESRQPERRHRLDHLSDAELYRLEELAIAIERGEDPPLTEDDWALIESTQPGAGG